MHRNRPRALHGNPAVDGDAGPTLYGEMNLLGRRKVDVLGGGDELDIFLGQELHFIALGLQVDIVLGGNQFEAGVAVTRGDGAGQQADGLAAVDSGFTGHSEVGVFAAFEDEGFAVGVLQVLSGDGADAGFAGLEDGRVGEVRAFVGAGVDGFLLGVGLGAVLVFAVDHAAADFVQGIEGGGLGVDLALLLPLGADGAGKLDGLVGGSRLVEGFGEGGRLFEQRHGGSHVARRLAGGAGPGGHDEALAGSEGPPGVGAEFGAGAAEAATVVVGLVNEVAEVEFAVVLGGFELQALLLVGVVEGELGVASTAEFLALEAAERCGVVVLVLRGTVPGRAVSAGGVALTAGAVVGGGVEERVAGFLLAFAARGGCDAALALPVVEGTEDDGAVDVAAEEVDEDFLTDARQPLPAHARPGLPVEDADPAGIPVVRRFGLLPVEADLDPAKGVAPEFVVAVGAGLAFGADDDGAHRARGGRPGVDAGAGTVLELRTPRGVGGVGVEGVAVAAFDGEFEEFGREFTRGTRGHGEFSGGNTLPVR